MELKGKIEFIKMAKSLDHKMGHCHEMILHCLSPCSEEDDAKFYEDGSCDNSYAVLSLIFLQF